VQLCRLGAYVYVGVGAVVTSNECILVYNILVGLVNSTIHNDIECLQVTRVHVVKLTLMNVRVPRVKMAAPVRTTSTITHVDV
jgi:hypothetical protein